MVFERTMSQSQVSRLYAGTLQGVLSDKRETMPRSWEKTLKDLVEENFCHLLYNNERVFDGASIVNHLRDMLVPFERISRVKIEVAPARCRTLRIYR